MDLIFEKSMQTVDPSVTMPYWDYTIERATNISVWESPLFTESTFGNLSLPKDTTFGWSYKNDSMDDGKIFNGRWKDLQTTSNTKFTSLNYGYGLMRAPWNMNPSYSLTRFTSTSKDLPSCQSHYSMLSNAKLSNFLNNMPYSPHGATHIAIGGVYGCDAMDSLREQGYINDLEGQVDLCKNWIFYMKELYRMNVITPKSGCSSVDENGEWSVDYDDQNCGYNCNPDNENELMNCLKGGGSKPASTPITNIINCVTGDMDESLLNSNDDCVPDIDEMPDEGWVAWKDFICTGDGYKVFGGDHLESASPADPSFWPIHPTLERLLQVKYMAGGFDTNDWPTDPVSSYVCGHHECFDITYGGYGAWDSCCYGHYQDDQYMDFSVGLKSAHTGPTNREIFDGTDPTSTEYTMNYIYDSFTWDHCLNDGYDFEALFESLVST
jgi:Common central domain of tyrosinase